MRSCIVLPVCAALCWAAHPVIPAGSTIYVDPQNGFDKLMADALQTQHVPVTVVTTAADKADFSFSSVVMPTWDVVQSRRTGGTVGSKSAAAVKLTAKSGEIVWRLTVPESVLKHGDKAVAEDCAKHIKDLVAKAK